MSTFTDNSKKIIARVRRATDEAVTETAEEITQMTKSFAPVLTGALRDSYRHEKVGFAEEQIGSPLNYSVFQELGTSRQSAQSHLLPAVLQNQDELPKKIKRKMS